MASLNKVILIGNLGGDPELRKTSGDLSIAQFSIATSEKRKDESGNFQEKTEWHKIVAFGRTAEIVSEYLKKGSSVCIEGKIQYSSWEKDGQKHYKTEIIANNLVMLGKKSNESSNNNVSDNYSVSNSSETSEDDLPF